MKRLYTIGLILLLLLYAAARRVNVFRAFCDGAAQARGWRDFLGKLKSAHPGLALSSEDAGEAYLDLFDSNNVFIRVDISDVYDYHYKYFVEDNFYEAIMEIVLDWKAPWEA